MKLCCSHDVVEAKRLCSLGRGLDEAVEAKKEEKLKQPRFFFPQLARDGRGGEAAVLGTRSL